RKEASTLSLASPQDVSPLRASVRVSPMQSDALQQWSESNESITGQCGLTELSGTHGSLEGPREEMEHLSRTTILSRQESHLSEQGTSSSKSVDMHKIKTKQEQQHSLLQHTSCDRVSQVQ
ncbi:unnamed protein product, partial [Amoebophrya sp. A25]